MIRLQGPTRPAAMRDALMDCIGGQQLLGAWAVSAYMTLGGCRMFETCCLRNLGRYEYEAMPKRVIASVDFGLTEPEALRYWMGLPNTDLRIAGSENIREAGLAMPRRAFHPKFYVFQFDDLPNAMVGSANLTTRGFTINTEAAIVDIGTRTDLERLWSEAAENTVPCTEDLIERYAIARARTPRPSTAMEVEPVPARALPPAGGLALFSEAVAGGALNPEDFDAMWVQVSRLQGGSGNQLELPRGAHRFFGYAFDHYGAQDVEHIGHPTFKSGRWIWPERALTWHGNNRMERINLPTQAAHGFDYADSLVLFRRLPDGLFELAVAPAASELALAWQNAAAENGHLFRLGARTDRLAGFLAQRDV